MDELAFDTVVVGSGPGGCVVARRLAEGGQRVALIESGSSTPLPESLRFLSAVGDSASGAFTWPGLAIGYGNPGGSDCSVEFPYIQGRALGGSSAINSMVLSSGDEEDYLGWEVDLGCDDWGPEPMGRWLQRAAAAMPVQYVSPGGITETVMGTLSGEVMPQQTTDRSSLEFGALGLVDAALAAKDGQRCTAFEALVADHIGSGEGAVELFPGTTVSRVVVSRRVATGVETETGRSFAAKNVVLAAGAIGSPKLLHRSISGLEHLGQSIVDHPSFAFAVTSSPTGTNNGAAPTSAVSKLFRFSNGAAHHRTGEIQVLVIENVSEIAGDLAAKGIQALSVVVVSLLSPTSKGSMRFGSGLGLQINRGCLETSTDRIRFRSGVRRVASLLDELAATGSLTGVSIDDRGTPATELLQMADDELDRWLQTHPGPVAHLAAGCRMGPSPDRGAITSCWSDSPGQVYGTSGLYVADSSVLPTVTSGGLQLPVMAVSERIAAAMVE